MLDYKNGKVKQKFIHMMGTVSTSGFIEGGYDALVKIVKEFLHENLDDLEKEGIVVKTSRKRNRKVKKGNA